MVSGSVAVASVAGFSVVMAGLLSGLELGTGMAHHTARALPEQSWTLNHQGIDRLFRKVIPPAFLLTIACLLATAFLTSGLTRDCFAVAAGLTAVEVALTVSLNVPINKRIEGWTAGSAPADWAEHRDTWMRNHWSRSLVGLAGFVVAIAGLIVR